MRGGEKETWTDTAINVTEQERSPAYVVNAQKVRLRNDNKKA
jgi:hypothetical protein